MKIKLLLILLLAGSVMAGQVVISSYPARITNTSHTSAYNAGTDKADTITWVADSLNLPGGLIEFDRTSNWCVDGEGKIVVYGTDSTISTTSLKRCIRWYAANVGDSNFVIHKGDYRHRPDNFYGDSAAGRSQYRQFRPYDDVNNNWAFISLYTNRLRKVILDSVKADIMGYQGNTFVGSGERIAIRACSLYCRTAGFGNRSGFYANAINVDGLDTADITVAQPGDSDYYNVRIDNSYVYSNGQTGIYVGSGDGIVQIRNTTFKGDVRNHADTAGSNEYYSTTNSYLVWFQGVVDSSMLFKCSILAGDNYKGARGIHLYTADGTTYPIIIDSNYGWLHDGYSTQYPTSSHSAAVKIRDGITGLEMTGNEFYIVVDTFNSSNSGGYLYSGDTVAYLNSGSVLTLQENTFNDPGDDHPWDLDIYNNIWEVVYRSNNTTGSYRNTSIYAFDNQLEEDTTVKIYGNVGYYVNSYATYGHPGFDGSGAFCVVYRDTLHKVDTTIDGTTITNSADSLIVMNNYGDSATNNVLRDIYWASGGYPGVEDDAHFIPYGGAADHCDLTWQRTLEILIADGDGNPIEGADVVVTDFLANNQIDTTTGADGIASGVVNFLFLTADSSDIDYNPFTITVNYGGQEIGSSLDVNYANYADTLTFGEATETTTKIILRGGKFRGGKI